MTNPHIQVISRPTSGKLYIIGDIHGEIRAFKAVLNELRQNDTLIIAGDLIDRGRDENNNCASHLILNEIGVYQSRGYNILAIKGNHEVDFLRIIDILKHPLEERIKKIRIIKDILLIAFKNGSSWIFKDDCPKKTDLLQIYASHYSTNSNKNADIKAHLECFAYKILTAANCFEYLIDNIYTYYDYIKSLPYIIKIDDALKPAWIAHAELRMSDDILNEKIITNTMFTDGEIEILTNTRPNNFLSERTSKDCIVYCGHNTIDEEPNLEPFPTKAIRSHSNHCNLDSGAYFSGAFLRVNHFDDVVTIINGRTSSPEPFIISAQNDIQIWLIINNAKMTNPKNEIDLSSEVVDALLEQANPKAPATKKARTNTSPATSKAMTLPNADSLATFGQFSTKNDEPVAASNRQKRKRENNNFQP